MSLAPGTRLGPYEVRSLLGAGGMGEVYRARDSKLDRDVAIKILPVMLSTDPDRLGRFEREAKAVAALSDPNILAIHDFGTHDGITYAVTELLEGETLRERLTRGALPFRKAIDVAVRIAHGLAAAHDQHLVHRDLKPENLFLTRSGQVKILDFGLAKPSSGTARLSSAVDDPTRLATEVGTVLGTVGYMAPEQVRGEPVDARADLFAFGAVLYEMLTGTRAFHRETTAETMTAILKEEPPAPSARQAELPPSVDSVVRHCLEKNPHERFQSARDLAFNLESLKNASAQSGPVAAVGKHASLTRRELVAWLLVMSLMIGAIVTWFSRPPAARVIEFSLDEDADISISAPANSLAISPDGSRVFFSGSQDRQLYMRLLGQRLATPIAGTNLGRVMFADNQWVWFSQSAWLKKVSLVDGKIVTICQADTRPKNAAAADGQVVYSTGSNLFVVPANGGMPQPLTTLDPTKGEFSHNVSGFLPDGKTLLFANWRKDGVDVEALTLATGKHHVVVEQASRAWYVNSGYLLFVRDGAVFSVPFDLKRLTPTGSPKRVIERVRTDINGNARLAVSDSGDVATYAAPGTAKLVWVTRDGSETLLDLPERDFQFPRISPDGRSVAFGDEKGVWVSDLAKDNAHLVSSEKLFNRTSDWNPKGSELVYPSAHSELAVKPADGSGQARALAQNLAHPSAPSWSPDGKTLAFTAFHLETDADIYVLPADGSAPSRPLVDTKEYDAGPQFSPDGRLVAYTSAEYGPLQVFITPFPGPGPHWRVSTDGGTHARWSRSPDCLVKGHDCELFYRNGDDMMAVKVTLGPEFNQDLIGKPVRLFSGTYSYGGGLGLSTYDVAADGRFLMIKQKDPTSERPRVVVHFTERLK